MKNIISIVSIAIILILSFSACKKVADDKDLWIALKPVVNAISDTVCLGSDPLKNAYNGTMLAGKTYNVCGDIFVNTGDTLTIEPGVIINFKPTNAGKPTGLAVKGVLLCLGTKEKPILITVPGITKTDQLGADPNNDPALKGKWTGIIGATTCPMMIIKWTKIEFGGGTLSASIGAYTGAAIPYPVYFANPNGIFVMEDSWLYGSVDDPWRINGGKIHVMRNVFEKCGYTGGEAMNAKAGTIGDFAYNLCIGIATNGPKLSNINVLPGAQASNVRMYNNTIVNCGFRRAAAGRGGSVNIEQGAGGYVFNNLIVNCKFGIRIVQNPIADTANILYGYNFSYADSVNVASQFLPSLSISTAITKAVETDIPKPSTFLPVGWTLGAIYTAPASIVGANNPQFVNAPVPLPAGLKLGDIAVKGNFDFRLKANSPCINAGFVGFYPRADVALDPKYGATEITPPGRDIGAYQRSGLGNQY